MTTEEENKLRTILKAGERLVWNPDSETCCVIVAIGSHAEEEDNTIACAIFEGGKYVALYNCPIEDFATLKRL